jgi:tRNA threonylcarbamoyladenosine biosynthesis protein TsaE
MREVLTASSAETLRLGAQLGALLQPGDLLCLYGELGTGKTTFTKGIAQGIGGINSDAVTSPTFTILNIYRGTFPLYHFDLFRLSGVEELEDIGYREYFQGDGICVVEWAEKGAAFLPEERLDVTFQFWKEEQRKILFTPWGVHFTRICQHIGE